MKFIYYFSFLFLSLAMFSCGEDKSSVTNKSEIDLLDNLTVDNSISQEEKNIRIQKMNIYIDCINSASSVIEASFNKYTSWSSVNDGPGESLENVRGINDVSLNVLEPCINNIEIGNQLNVLPNFDEIGKSYIESIKNVQKEIHDAFIYYSTKQYFDDMLVTGREMHPKLVSAYKFFFEVDKLVRKEISKARNDINLAYIASLKEKKDTFSYLKEVSMLRADKFLEEALIPQNEFDISNFNHSLEKFEISSKMYKNYIKNGEFDDKMRVLADNYAIQMDGFLKSAKRMKEFKSGNLSLTEDQIMLKKNGGSSMILGTPENINLLSNKMINAYNDFVIQLSQEKANENIN